MDQTAASNRDAAVTRERVPKHIAVIMDGNGRWAQQQGMPRIEGHRRGVEAVRKTMEACRELGIEVLSLYCLSSENWKRPKEELDFLMALLCEYLIVNAPTWSRRICDCASWADKIVCHPKSAPKSPRRSTPARPTPA